MIILVVAGDPSGDLHGSHLIEALRRADPSLHVAAVGGPLMKAQAHEFLEDLASRGVTGFWEPLVKIGFLLSLGSRLNAFLKDRKPDAVVCIDYYGFNRRVLGLARRHGVPAFYYVSPQVWASRPARVQVLKRLVRRMLVIFPFEEKLYHRAGVPSAFVGHPLLDILPQPAKKDGLAAPLELGLLPGSRPSEVSRHLPLFLEALSRLRRSFPQIKACVFASPSLPDEIYAGAVKSGAELVRESDYARRRMLDLALCSSGTATLENALLGIPMVVVYKLSWPTYAIARAIVSVPYISMVNILAGKLLVPELIQGDATAENVAAAAKSLLEDPRRHEALKKELTQLRSALGGGQGRPGAAAKAAQEILRGIAG